MNTFMHLSGFCRIEIFAVALVGFIFIKFYLKFLEESAKFRSSCVHARVALYIPIYP